MATRQTPQEMMNEAIALARAHNMYIVNREDHGRPVHILYRRLPTGSQGIRLGRSSSIAGFRRLVRRCAGIA